MANKVEYINVTDIYIDKDRLWNVYEKDVESLKESISNIGLITPIAVQWREDKYKLIAGEHRLTVCKELGWETIPAHIIDRKYDNDEIEDARLEVMEADENIKRKKGDFIAEGLILKRRKKAYDKIVASENGIDLNKTTVEDYKKTLNNSLDTLKRNVGRSAAEQPNSDLSEKIKDLKEKINNIKTFKDDAVEKTGLSESTISRKLRIGNVFEDKHDVLKQLDDKNVSERTISTYITVGKDIEDVKDAAKIQSDILTGLELPDDININTFYKKAIEETKKVVGDKDMQKNDPVAFAKEVEKVVPKLLNKDTSKEEYLQLNDSDLDDINIALAENKASEIVILFNNKEIYRK